MSALAQPVPVTDPGRKRTGSKTAGGVLTIIGLVLWSLVLIVLCAIVPKFEQIFRDFGVELSLMTRASLGASRWLMGRNTGQMFPGIIIAAPVLLGVAFGFYCARRYWVLALLFMLAGMQVIGTLVVANFLPLVAMVESLQKGKP